MRDCGYLPNFKCLGYIPLRRMKALSYCNLFCHFLSYCYGYFCSLANGFFPVRISSRTGVPTRLKVSRKCLSR